MDKKNKIYFYTNIVFIGIAISLMIKMFFNIDFHIKIWNLNDFGYLLLIFLGIFIIFVLKFFRFYLILLEQKIPLNKFIKIYLKTVFITQLFPFKSGEFFRMYVYGYYINNYKTGFLSVLVDRFIDTIALLLIILPFEIIAYQKISVISLFLIVFVLVFIVMYSTIPTTLKYLNKFFILNSTSKRSLYALKIIENIEQWYGYVVGLLKDRAILIFIISGIAWGIECGILFVISQFINLPFEMKNFIQYISSILLDSNNKLVSVYILLNGILIFVLSGIIYCISYMKGNRKK